MTKTPEELTADWKAGKLEADKDYYIEIAGGVVIIDYYTQQEDNSYYPLGLGFDLSSNKFIERILAPVPTYGEYKAMQDQIADASKKVEELEDEIAELKEENKQLEEDTGYGWYTAGIESDKNDKLRDLLKECQAHLSLGEIGTSVTPINILIDRINAALGESEE